MAWFKVDDQLAFHQKVIMAGNEAMGLWVRAGAWASAQLTDGFIPTEIVQAMANEGVCHRLLLANLWTEVEGGFQFHDWSEFQPSAEAELQKREEIRKARSEAGKKGAAARWKKSDDGKHGKTMASAKANAKANAMANEWQNDGPDPDPISISKDIDVTKKVSDEKPREDVEAVLDRIDQHCTEHDFKIPSRSKANQNAARLLIDKDGRTLEQILWILDWVTSNSFWTPNIRSASKLRDQFDQLKGQAVADYKPKPATMSAADRRLAEVQEREQRILAGEFQHLTENQPYAPLRAIDGGNHFG